MAAAAALLIILQAVHAEGAVGRAEDANGSFGAPGQSLVVDRDPTRIEDERWIRRYAPVRNQVELGVYSGTFVPGKRLELFEPDHSQDDQGFTPYATAATAVGGRLGFFPSRFFGAEAEGGAAFTKMQGGGSATLWNVRGSLVGQVGLRSVTPFVLAGLGALGVESDTVGTDIDPAIHVGGGAKVFLSEFFAVRLDLRDVIGSARGLQAGENHNFEATVGLVVTLGRRAQSTPRRDPLVLTMQAAPDDADADGVADVRDACAHTWGELPNGCPAPDADRDGVADLLDICPDQIGEAPDGCPRLAALHGQGCGDGGDVCANGPSMGSLPTVRFSSDDAALPASSRAGLRMAAERLQQDPSARLRIIGHTDSWGTGWFNQRLSVARARAARDYLVGQGIAPERVEVQGRSSHEPAGDNNTRAGRAANRRIELEWAE